MGDNQTSENTFTHLWGRGRNAVAAVPAVSFWSSSRVAYHARSHPWHSGISVSFLIDAGWAIQYRLIDVVGSADLTTELDGQAHAGQNVNRLVTLARELDVLTREWSGNQMYMMNQRYLVGS